MPIIYNHYGISEATGTGIERLSLSHENGGLPEESRQWLNGNPLPDNITVEYLRSAPTALISSLRRIALLQLLRDPELQVDYKISEPGTVMALLTGDQPRQVGQVQTIAADWGRDNYIIPIAGNTGAVEIVVDKAYGVGWQLAANHPMVAALPQLGRTRKEDNTLPPSYFEHNQRYISAQTLADATPIDTPALALRLQRFLSKFIVFPKTKAEYSSASLAQQLIDSKTRLLDFSVLDHGGLISVMLHLGENYGYKFVTCNALYDTNTIDPDLLGMAAEAEEIGKLIESFYKSE